jgi:hypothetical protein
VTYIRSDGAKFRDRTEGSKRTSVRLVVNGEILFFDTEWHAQQFLHLCLDTVPVQAVLYRSRRVMTLEQGRLKSPMGWSNKDHFPLTDANINAIGGVVFMSNLTLQHHA